MPTAEHHNRLQGAGLVVQVWERLQALPSDAHTTCWVLAREIGEPNGMFGDERYHLYERIRTVVRNLELCAFVRTEKKWNAGEEKYLKQIYRCSE